MIEFTKDNTTIEDCEIWDDCTGMDCYLSTWFYTFEKFGIKVDNRDHMSIDCYLVCFFDGYDLDLKVDYVIKNLYNGFETYETYEPNENEKSVLREMLEDFIQHECGKSIKQCLQEEKKHDKI